MRRALAVLAAVVVAALGTVSPAATAAPLPQATSCSGVWVVVGSSVRCATSYGDGLTALRSAGFSVETTNGLICRIDGAPATCTASFSAYWSYWHAARTADGSYGAWAYSAKGASQYRPARGDAEGWSFGDGSKPPGARPPTTPATTAPAAPAPAATTTRPATTAPRQTTAATSGTTSGATSGTTSGATSGTTSGASAAPVTGAGPAPTAAGDPPPPTDAPAPPDATPTALASGTPAPVEAAPTASTRPTGASGPATAVFALGALALGGVGVAWAVRRRRTP